MTILSKLANLDQNLVNELIQLLGIISKKQLIQIADAELISVFAESDEKSNSLKRRIKNLKPSELDSIIQEISRISDS